MTAALFWYPAGRPLKKISLSQEFSTIVESEEVDDAESESISGRRSRIVYNTRRLVRLVSELITDIDDIHELMALVSHLRADGTVMIAEDQAKTLGAFARVLPEAGDTQVVLHPNIFAALGSGWTPSADEVLYLRGPSPRGRQEPVVCSGAGSGGYPTLSTGPRHDWTGERWAFVHNARFWPFLRLQRGRHSDPLLFNERRIHYTLDLPLEESPWSLERIAQTPGVEIKGEAEEHGLPTIDDITGTIPGPGSRSPVGSGPGSIPGNGSGPSSGPSTGPGWY